jgi:hypothetical protein
MTANVCAVCGALGTVLWTLDNMQVAVVAHLCPEHAAPLEAIVLAAGTAPPDEREEPLTPRRVARKRGMEPLDWTPPS